MRHDLFCSAFLRAAVFAAFAVLAFTASGAAAARDLPPIDRLAEAPLQPQAVARKSAPETGAQAIHWHDQLDLPTFVWAQRDGAVATKLAAAGVSAADEPVVAARGYLRALRDLYALPEEQVAEVPVLFAQA